MDSKGTTLFCKNCGSKWEWLENGDLLEEGKQSKFTHIPDWYNWERENVRKEVLEGKYSFEDDVEVYTLPRAKNAINIGMAKVRHTIEEGFVLEGHYKKKDYRIIRKPLA